VQLKPGDFVLEVVSGPVPTLDEAVQACWYNSLSCVSGLLCNGVQFSETSNTDFRRAAEFTCHSSNYVSCN
jgi:hypothetical protein